MASASQSKVSEIRKAVLAIGAGGLIAGTLDLGETLVVFGAKSPLVIAGGLLGPQNASRGGAAIYILGVLLHFLIVLSAAAIYFAASRRLHFLIEHWLICGLFFGVAIDVVMRLIVLPLSAMHARTLSVPRFSSGAGCPHGPSWASYIVQRSAVRQGN